MYSYSNLTFRVPCIVSIFLIYFQQDVTIHSLFISGKLFYMFRVVSPPIIRSTHKCIYSIWYLSDRYCYLPLYRQVAGLYFSLTGLFSSQMENDFLTPKLYYSFTKMYEIIKDRRKSSTRLLDHSI